MCHLIKLHLIHPRSEPLLAPDLKGELVLDGGGELNDVDLKQVSYRTTYKCGNIVIF